MNMLTNPTIYSLNHDADTMEEAMAYMDYRAKQLGKFGYKLKAKDKLEVGPRYLFTYKDSPTPYQAIYVLRRHRNKGKYIKALKLTELPVVTLKDCNIIDYLIRYDIPFECPIHSDAYELISDHYGDQRTKRSGVPLIYHIDEGGTILNQLGAREFTKDAYYLHPIFQSDEAFLYNYKKYARDIDQSGISPIALTLAIEYRHVANSYLSTDSLEDFYGFTCPEVKQMLIADKVQNFKDFMKYHYGIHKRTRELYEYFVTWEELLEINYNDYIPLIE